MTQNTPLPPETLTDILRFVHSVPTSVPGVPALPPLPPTVLTALQQAVSQGKPLEGEPLNKLLQYVTTVAPLITNPAGMPLPNFGGGNMPALFGPDSQRLFLPPLPAGVYGLTPYQPYARYTAPYQPYSPYTAYYSQGPALRR